MKILLLFAFAAVSQAAIVSYTSFPDWQAATVPGPYGVESYVGGVTGLTTGGTAPRSVGGGALHVWLFTPGTVTFELTGGGGFGAFILNLDTAPAGPGSGVVLKADGATFATVGLAGVFNGWIGFTSTSVVQQVSLSTLSWIANGLPWDHGDIPEIRWVEAGGAGVEVFNAVPEPGGVWLGALGGVLMLWLGRRRRC